MLAETIVVGSTRYGAIGDVMVLSNTDYDPDQLWLPFMTGVILRQPPEDYYYGPRPEHRPRWVKKIAERGAKVPPRCQKMYEYLVQEQCLIPFVEYRYCGPGEYHMAKWKWPISENGRPIHQHSMSMIGMTVDDFVAWGKESFDGRFTVEHGSVFFEKEVDWLFTKLRFAGEALVV